YEAGSAFAVSEYWLWEEGPMRPPRRLRACSAQPLFFNYGTFLDVRFFLNYVRFTPESRHLQCTSACPLRARSGHSACLLDHFVGAPEERQRDCEPEHLGGLEVQDQLDLVACCTGRSAGFSPLRIRPV